MFHGTSRPAHGLAPALLLLALGGPAMAQELPMTREGLDSVLAQYFAGADRDHDGKLDRAETATALGYARQLLTERRDAEPFVMDVAPDGSARLSLNQKGPLGRAGLLDMVFARADANGDGSLSLAEVQAVAHIAFDAADRDRDGILDDAERAAAQRHVGLLRGLLGGGG